MKSKWKIVWTEFALNDLRKLDKHIARIIVLKATSDVEAADNIKDILKPLKYGKSGQYRLRVGNYRVICRIQYYECIVEAISIGHRKNIYK